MKRLLSIASACLFASTAAAFAQVAEQVPVWPTGIGSIIPNPASGTVWIRLYVVDTVQVTLTAFDALGRPVATIVDARVAPNMYDVVWNTVGIPSGMYWCRMNAGSYVRSEKLFVVR
jgi:hypothetical protein